MRGSTVLVIAESLAKSKKRKAFLTWHININFCGSTYNSLSIELGLSFLPSCYIQRLYKPNLPPETGRQHTVRFRTKEMSSICGLWSLPADFLRQVCCILLKQVAFENQQSGLYRGVSSCQGWPLKRGSTIQSSLYLRARKNGARKLKISKPQVYRTIKKQASEFTQPFNQWNCPDINE